MNNSLSELTVIVVTFKTDITLLKNCLNSIDSRVKVILVENSNSFENKNEIESQYKNVKIVCSGSNLGYGSGNNFGLNETKTRYALILNPDVICKENYFKNREEFKSLHENLRKVKIIFDDPISASKHLNEVWNNVDDWWESKDVKMARKRFMEEAVLIQPNALEKWKNFLNNIST